ncbi:hypothetical protein [Halogranum amylolyticum]|uniref:hypothetical protein n=1 Tax=Halogranum amylolyticum TaxID=660520 RepID=UPI000A7C85C9|nr:hypothetical protein [Halogranum amylolyticum]
MKEDKTKSNIGKFKEDSRLKSRRSLLKGVGFGLATAPLASGVVAAGKPSSREVYEKSLRLRERASWNNEKWYKYLEKRGFDVKYNKEVRKVPLQSQSSGPTIQKYNYADFEFIVTYVTDYSGAAFN